MEQYHLKAEVISRKRVIILKLMRRRGPNPGAYSLGITIGVLGQPLEMTQGKDKRKPYLLAPFAYSLRTDTVMIPT